MTLACTTNLDDDFGRPLEVDDDANEDDSAEDDSADDDSADDDSADDDSADDTPDGSVADESATDDDAADESATDDDVVDDSAVDDDAVDDAVDPGDDVSTDDTSPSDDGALDDVIVEGGMGTDDSSDDTSGGDPGDAGVDAGVNPTDDGAPDDDSVSDDGTDDTVGDDAPTDDEPEAGDPVEAGTDDGTIPEASVDPPMPLRVLEISPAPGAAGVGIDASLLLRFDRDAVAGSGAITIVDLDAGESFITLELDDLQVELDGASVRVDLDGLLAPSTGYAVSVPATAFSDGEGGTFAGLSGSTWSFRTESVEIPGAVDAADLLLWLDAQLTGSIKHQDGSILTWADRSDNAFALVQTDSGARPAFVTSGIGGEPSVRFDGSSSWLEGPDLDGPEEFELFVVWQSPIVPSDELGVIFANGFGSGMDPNLQFMHGHSVADFTNAAVTFTDDYLSLRFDAPAADTTYVWNASRGATAGMVVRTNGAESSSDPTVVEAAPDPEQAITLGGFDGNYPFEGDIGEVLLYSRELSTEERAAVEVYLSERWGVSLTP